MRLFLLFWSRKIAPVLEHRPWPITSSVCFLFFSSKKHFFCQKKNSTTLIGREVFLFNSLSFITFLSLFFEQTSPVPPWLQHPSSYSLSESELSERSLRRFLPLRDFFVSFLRVLIILALSFCNCIMQASMSEFSFL